MMTTQKGQCTEVDHLAQRELFQLERSFRGMQEDRAAIPDSTRKTLTKQEHLIKILEKEKMDLKIVLSFAEAVAVTKVHEKATHKIQEAFTSYLDAIKDIKSETKSVGDIKEKIREVDKDISEVNLTHNIAENSVESIKKQDIVLDNLRTRLHVETVKFNQVSLGNKEIKKEIDHLLQERGRFNKIFQVLGKRLKMGKQIITDLIEQNTISYDDRHEAQAKLEALKIRAKNDLLTHCVEMKELLRRVQLRSQLNNFIAVKGQKRICLASEINDSVRKEEKKQEMLNYLNTFNEVVTDIMNGFTEPNVEHLVDKFLKFDEDNYNIFSFINDLNKKLDGLREEICDIEIKITEQRKMECELIEHREIVLNQLNSEYTSIKGDLEEVQTGLVTSTKASEGLLRATHDLSKVISINNESVVKKLGRNNTITRFNIEDYLKLIETRMIELFLECSYFAYRPPRKSTHTGKGRPSGKEVTEAGTRIGIQPCPLCAELIDISEVDESIATPWNKNELAVVLTDTIQRGLYSEIVHPVEECHLPKSRRIIQKRMN